MAAVGTYKFYLYLQFYCDNLNGDDFIVSDEFTMIIYDPDATCSLPGNMIYLSGGPKLNLFTKFYDVKDVGDATPVVYPF